MLLSALSFACLLVAHVANGQCESSTTKPPRVTEKSNYVIDYFSGSLLFTYAINRCTATSIFGVWYKYACIQSNDGSWSVKRTKYNDAACSNGATDAGSYAQGDSVQGEVGYFECSGSDNYVEVEVSINPDCSGSQVVSAGLGGCTHNSPLLTEFYCDSTQALVQLYVDPATLTTAEPSTTEAMYSTTGSTGSTDSTDSSDSTETWTNSSATYDAYSSSSTTDYAYGSSSTTGDAYSSSSTTEYETTENTGGWSTTEVSPAVCYDSLYCNKWTFISQCKPVAEILKTVIYGKLDKCVITTDTTPTTTANNSAASSLFVITNLVFALAVTLFSLF